MAKSWPECDIDDSFYESSNVWRIKLTTKLPCGHEPSTTAKAPKREHAIETALRSLGKAVKGHRCKR